MHSSWLISYLIQCENFYFLAPVEYNSTEVPLPTPGITPYEARMDKYPRNFTNELVFRSSVQCTFYIQQNGNGMSDDDWLFVGLFIFHFYCLLYRINQ